MADFYFRFLPVYKKCDATTTHSNAPRLQPKRVFSCTSKSKLKMDLDQGWLPILKPSSKPGISEVQIPFFWDLASPPRGVEKGTSLPPVSIRGMNKHS